MISLHCRPARAVRPLAGSALLLFASACAYAERPNELSPEERRLGFEMLFDGRSFDGWTHGGNWVIEDGAMCRQGRGGDVFHVKRFVPDDFELRFEWKVAKGTNSGVLYRPGQVEYQVLDDANSPYGENPRTSAAALFFCMAPSQDVTRPYGEWNEGRIVCKGTVIQHWLNGEKVIEFDYADRRWARNVELLEIRGFRPPYGGDLSARRGFLHLQDHGGRVWFRSLRMRVIPKDETLPRSDVAEMPMPAAARTAELRRISGILAGLKKDVARMEKVLEDLERRQDR